MKLVAFIRETSFLDVSFEHTELTMVMSLFLLKTNITVDAVKTWMNLMCMVESPFQNLQHILM